MGKKYELLKEKYSIDFYPPHSCRASTAAPSTISGAEDENEALINFDKVNYGSYTARGRCAPSSRRLRHCLGELPSMMSAFLTPSFPSSAFGTDIYIIKFTQPPYYMSAFP